MGDGEALLAAVIDRPDDDTPRLVYADWCDDHGDPARAEFIRTQIELARGPDDTRRAVLETRELDLLAAHRKRWDEPFVDFSLGTEDPARDLTYRRGFVWRVHLDDDEDEFADRAAELFALAPIRRLEFWLKYRHRRSSRCPELLRVTELMTDRAGFEDDELQHLFASPYLQNLEVLDLPADDDNGHIGPGGIELLTNSTALPALRHLDLSGNWAGLGGYGDSDWAATLAAGPVFGRLEFLSLHGTGLNAEGVGHLARSPAVANLKHLDLSRNYIGSDGAEALIGSPYLDGLRVLDLRECEPEARYADDGELIPPELTDRLRAKFGDRVLLDGKAVDRWPML